MAEWLNWLFGIEGKDYRDITLHDRWQQFLDTPAWQTGLLVLFVYVMWSIGRRKE